MIKMVILLLVGKNQLITEVKKEVIKFWLRLSWIPLYGRVSGFIFTLDVLIFSLLTNSLLGLAFWGVASAVANIVTHSSQVSQALYPKLLATGKKEFAEKNLEKMMYVSIPLLAASIIFAKPALYVLNPLYVDGIYIVYFLSFRAFIHIFTNVFYNIIAAYEKVDLNKEASLKQYAKSKLFLIPTLNNIMTTSYIVILVLFLIILVPLNFSEINLVIIWSGILFVVSLPFFIYTMILVKKQYQISMPYNSILRYSMVALLSTIIVYFISDNFLVYSESIFDFLPQLIPIIIVGGIIYFGLTYVIDKSIRELFKSIINELKKKN